MSRNLNGDRMKTNQESMKQKSKAVVDALSLLGGIGTLDDIQKVIISEQDKRTLQRRLKELVREDVVRVSGRGRATKYSLQVKPESAIERADTPSEFIEAKSVIPLSNAARVIEGAVSQPIQKRKPIGYNREFLDSYKPNVSSYLTRADKERLTKVGITGFENALGGTYAKEILQRLLIDLAWNSSRLEGNTYSLLDTQLLLDNGVPAKNKSASEAQMILNHKDAIEFIVQSSEDIWFNTYTILNLHALLSNNLLPNPAASGRLRKHGVGIGGSVYTPVAVPQLIQELFEVILQKASEIKDPFEQSFFVMVQLPYLQPFDDVNKRVSRLAANIPLNKKNLAPLSFTEVPQQIYINGFLGVYELNEVELLKEVYIWAYERSAQQYAVQRQSIGEPDLFRVRYRNEIRDLIKDVIVNVMSKDLAAKFIQERKVQLPIEDQAKFTNTVESELLNLHVGNFARYYISPSEFKKWQEVWHS